jgi:putative membrane protein
VLLGATGVLGFLVLVRVFSMAITMVRYHEHRLTLVADDLRVSYGLFTRVNSTTPRRRIQTVTILEGPWHRLAGRATIQAVTAGGSMEGNVASREMLAPLVRREAIGGLLAAIVPEATYREADRQRAAPPALRRAVRRNILGWSLPLLGAAFVGLPALVVASALAALSLVASRGRVRRFAWQEVDDLLVLHTGWIWRRTTLVRHDRIQGVVTITTPFDRRHDMQQVEVDTAGIAAASLELPHLWREDAEALAGRLQTGAATTAFRV